MINDPTTRADEYLFNLLSNDAALTALVGNRIYADLEPQANTQYPICLWQWQASGMDVRPVGKPFVAANLLYLIKAIDRSFQFPQAVMDRVTTLLDNSAGTIASGGQVLFCQREMPWRLTEVDAGVTYKHVGATFRLLVQ